MALKKSELYSSLWKSCDELRGGMDASQYKDFVLVLLFVKYVSDKAATQKNYVLDVPKGGSFADMVAVKNDKEIGDKLNKIIAKLAAANDLRGVIDVADWNAEEKLGKGKDMVDRLSSLVGIFETLDFRGNRAEGDDLLGDAYEYLMRHFATESGKSKGQFYTPAEVSRIMAKVIGVGAAKAATQTIYDPTCGSGSLLLKAHDEAKAVKGLDLAVYGQENDNATAALARMNLILHDCPTGEVWKDNTLAAPHYKEGKTGQLKTFDFIVANPPFSTKAWTNGFDPSNDEFGRFPYGIPPEKNGDYAFLLHILASLKSTGTAAVVLPHGVLFRGGAEAAIRKEVVRRGYIKAIIGLPANLFYGTGIPACILVLDKAGAAGRKGVFMMDASKGFIKDGNKNRLREQDIHKIVDAFARGAELERYSRLVPLSEIAETKNDFNLNLPRYIDTSEPEDLQDLQGHMHGGIPERDVDALERYWKVFPSVRDVLFGPLRPGYVQLKVEPAGIKSAIFEHAEFKAWSQKTQKHFAAWRKESAPRLLALKAGDKPKAIIAELSEELLTRFEKAQLLDAYDVYQHLMDYWLETMQDDVYAIVSDGWLEAAKPRLLVEKKEQKTKEKPDLVIGKQKFKAELVPPALLIARYFASEQSAMDALETERAAAEQALEELAEEHGGDEGLLAEAKNDKDKITKASAAERLKSIQKDKNAADERELLGKYLALAEKEAGLAAKGKAAEKALLEKVLTKYSKLSADDVKSLVVEDKWLATLAATVQAELDRVSQSLTSRVKTLGERYGNKLPTLEADVETASAKVAAHLKKMGITW